MENTIEIINDDTVFIGTATEIVEQMRQQAYFERGIPLLDYLNRLPEFIKAYSGTDINLSGETLDERALSFIKELVKAGYFKEA
jgi:hypothetical protein